MIERIYDHLTSLGLPEIAVKVIFTAAFCVPLVLVVLYLPNLLGGSHPSPSYSTESHADAAPGPAPQSRAPETSTPHLKNKVGSYAAPDNAPKTIQPDSKKAKFSQLRNGMTVQEVYTIMGNGDIITEGRIPTGATSALHIYHYKDNFSQMILYGDDRIMETMEKQFEK